MKLVQEAKTLKTNADFTSQDFTIGDTAVVIEILRNKLYRHKIRTLVQEYISNARDAMREANSKGQVEVTVPTMFSPTFKVRDYGLGISEDRMYNVFIKYAASTKRTSNKQTGGFGIGAKSAWSYTESFSIVTYIDGIQRTYVAHIGANNNGRLDYMGECNTDQANGTEIQIPVSPKDVFDFKRAVQRATYFWNDNEKPLVKGLSKEDMVERKLGSFIDNIEVNNELPDFILSKWGNGIVVSIDGIPYVLENELVEKVAGLKQLSTAITGKLVLHVGNGELEVSASREEISDSKFSLDNLNTLGKTLHSKVIAMLQKEFANAKTPFEHLSVYMKYYQSYNLEKFRKFTDFIVNDKNGVESPLFEKMNVDVCTLLVDTKGNSKLMKRELGSGSRRRRYYSNRHSHIKAETFDKLYYVDITEGMTITNYRIRELLKTNPEVIVFSKLGSDTGEYDKAIKGLGLKKLSLINYTAPTRQQRLSMKVPRTKQQFTLWNCDLWRNRVMNTSLEDNTQQWLYVERKNDNNINELNELSKYLNKQGYKVCELSQDSIRRVKGDKNFKPLADFLKLYKATPQDIAQMKFVVMINHHLINEIKQIKGLTNKIVVDIINEYIGFYKLSVNGTKVPDMLKNIIGIPKEIKDFKDTDKKFTEYVDKKLALLKYLTINPKVFTDIADYINSK